MLPDVNVLIYAFRRESPEHVRYRSWVEDILLAEHRFAISELVLSSVVRIASTPQIFRNPETMVSALSFANALRTHPHAVIVAAGPTHWDIFVRLCRESGTTGKTISDVYHAALAIEHGCEWITADGDFSRFRGLRSRHPFR